MRGDLRCLEGRLWRHDPQYDDPHLETDVGQCPDCSGDGCGDDGGPVSKVGRTDVWFPQQRQKDGGEPCGECHLQPGERCDICGAESRSQA